MGKPTIDVNPRTAVHKKIFEKHPFFGDKTWNLACDFEAWNGANLSTDWKRVSCSECLEKKARRKNPLPGKE